MQNNRLCSLVLKRIMVCMHPLQPPSNLQERLKWYLSIEQLIISVTEYLNIEYLRISVTEYRIDADTGCRGTLLREYLIWATAAKGFDETINIQYAINIQYSICCFERKKFWIVKDVWLIPCERNRPLRGPIQICFFWPKTRIVGPHEVHWRQFWLSLHILNPFSNHQGPKGAFWAPIPIRGLHFWSEAALIEI